MAGRGKYSTRRTRRAAHLGRATLLTGVALLVAIVAFTGLAAERSTPAEASHFRADQTTWRLTAPDTVEFTMVTSFRASYYPVTALGQTFSEGSLYFGDGGSTVVFWTAVSLDPVNDVVTGHAVISHTYASSGPWTVELNTCCRLGTGATYGHMNNPDGNIVVRSVIDLAQSTGSPISAISPIVGCPENAACNFTVPATDPDGAQLRFRLADGGDGFGGQPSGATINPTTGLYSWDTTGAALHASGNTFYSTQVIIEKWIGGVLVGSSAVDFFIRVGTGTGGSAPYFDPPTPADAAVLNASLGQPFTFDVHAHDDDTGDIITLGLLNKPADATFVQHVTPAGHGEGTFEWTPTVAGDFFVVLTATDQTGLSATQRAVTIRVGTAANTAAVDDSYSTTSGTPLTVGAPGVLGNDLAPVTATLVTDVTNGTLVLAGDGSFTYTPTGAFVGADQFTYTAGPGSNTATVTIGVSPRGTGIIPTPGGQGTTTTTTTTTVPSSTTTTPSSTSTTEPTPTTGPTPSSVPGTAVPTTAPPFTYDDCDEVRAAGAAPILAGSYGFGSHLDGDGDGVGCEPDGRSLGTGTTAPLARTGLPVMALLACALTMITLGGVILAADRRRQAA